MLHSPCRRCCRSHDCTHIFYLQIPQRSGRGRSLRSYFFITSFLLLTTPRGGRRVLAGPPSSRGAPYWLCPGCARAVLLCSFLLSSPRWRRSESELRPGSRCLS